MAGDVPGEPSQRSGSQPGDAAAPEIALRRIYLVRHGETEGQSSIRYHGSGDVALSDEGRGQMEGVRAALPFVEFDLVVASPLRRSWEGARILSAGAPVRIEQGFREIDFGRWEGLTRDEIRQRDPDRYEQWQQATGDFAFPGGERRADFRERVREGLGRLLGSPARSALVVAHKGVIRTAAEILCGEPLPEERPEIGEIVHLWRERRKDGDGEVWKAALRVGARRAASPTERVVGPGGAH